MLPLFCMLNFQRIGKENGVYFIDSKQLHVCHNRRIKSNKVFKGIASRGKSSTGWFYGLKLFLIINSYGQIIRFNVTTGSIADNDKNILKKLFKNLSGVVIGDKGFISSLFEMFYIDGLKIITKIRNNMKNKLMDITEKLLLKKRGVIESVFDILMTICDIEHTRHRSPINAITHLFAGLTAYTYLDKVPSIFSKKFILS